MLQRPKIQVKNWLDSAANKGWSTVNYCQKLAFDCPYWSSNDHCDHWLFQEIINMTCISYKLFWTILNLFSWNLNTFTKHKEQVCFLFVCLFVIHIKTLFLKILQYSQENASVKFLGTPILKNIFVQLLLKWLYEVIFWNFVSQSHLKPSWHSNITKIPVTFKPKL